MKTELKDKFLQHILGKKKENQGFTLLQLLVVIIIIVILSAIAIPSFLNKATKPKQSEAKCQTNGVQSLSPTGAAAGTSCPANMDVMK